MMPNCAFCNEFGVKTEKSDIPKGSCYNRIIISSDHWCLVPTLGCFIDGYSLLVFSAHRPSLFFCSESEKKELAGFLPVVKDLYKAVYHTDVFLFEHGIVNESLSSPTSVDHVHLHVLPLTEEFNQIKDIIKQNNYPEYVFKDMPDISSVIIEHQIETYLLYFIDNSYHLVDVSNRNLQSQYLRKVIYDLVVRKTDDGWNWKSNPFHELMQTTYKKLKEAAKAFDDNH